MQIDTKLEAYLTSQIDQGGMAIREFVAKHTLEELTALMGHLASMNRSGNPWPTLVGTLAAYALAVGIRDEIASQREGPDALIR